MNDTTKSTWITRRISSATRVVWGPPATPKVGDVLLCEVISPSLHTRVETAARTRARLYPGDRIACVLGNRYATSLLRGVGESDGEHLHLLSASGLCGRVIEHIDRAAPPTELRLLAQGFHEPGPLRLRSFALPSPPAGGHDPEWVAVVGSAMDSGKTTACASVIHGLAATSRKVGAAKLTGTASARDFGGYVDAGAEPVFDFLDLGWGSTAGCSGPELEAIVTGLVGHLRAAEVDVAVLEIADGLLQTETKSVVSALKTILGPARIVFTAREGLAAVAGVEILKRQGQSVAVVSGVVTGSPLACREVERAADVACVPTPELGRWLAAAMEASPVAARAEAVAATAVA